MYIGLLFGVPLALFGAVRTIINVKGQKRATTILDQMVTFDIAELPAAGIYPFAEVRGLITSTMPFPTTLKAQQAVIASSKYLFVSDKTGRDGSFRETDVVWTNPPTIARGLMLHSDSATQELRIHGKPIFDTEAFMVDREFKFADAADSQSGWLTNVLSWALFSASFTTKLGTCTVESYIAPQTEVTVSGRLEVTSTGDASMTPVDDAQYDSLFPLQITENGARRSLTNALKQDWVGVVFLVGGLGLCAYSIRNRTDPDAIV
eukprot:TRINITY_DN5196_c0_g1_i1.p1 TRINITY_DN5196_c0_g1~~TRINITY_DN5196_c0_g1_i1.p1  ORF type:complete len:263 (-),score=46.10 TRINITY_DN5196_c0_g1_i1:25-813(-)